MEGGRHRQIEIAQQVAGDDLAIENPFEAGLTFAGLQAMFGRTTPAARQLSSKPLDTMKEN